MLFFGVSHFGGELGDEIQKLNTSKALKRSKLYAIKNGPSEFEKAVLG
jgi:hypothetical protein